MPIFFPIGVTTTAAGFGPLAAESSGAGVSSAVVRLRPLALAARSAGEGFSNALGIESANRFRSRSRGSSSSAPELALAPLALEAESAGASSSRPTLRVNGEGSVALFALSAGSSDSRAAFRIAARLVARSAGAGASFASLSSDSAFDVTFSIAVEIIPPALAPRPENVYRARLSADGSEVPIRSFRLEAAEGALGTSLSCALASLRPSAVSRSAVYSLALGVLEAPGSYRFAELISGARYGGRDHTIGLSGRAAADDLTLRFIDQLGDRWQYAPARDTSFLGAGADDDGAGGDSSAALRDEQGAVVAPVKVRVANLTLREALRRCYVTGCGFTSIETNLPDYSIARLDVSRVAGWHESLAPLLALYDPVYGAEGGRLRITDADQPLATGAPVYELLLGSLVTLKDSQPLAVLADSIEVVYEQRVRDREIVVGEPSETDDPIEAGRFGEPGYTATRATRTFRLYARETAPEEITRRELLRESRTVHNDRAELVHRETTQGRFDALGRKSAQTRIVESIVPTMPDGDLQLLEAQRDETLITYRGHPTEPRKFLQDATTTRTTGLVLADRENTYRDAPFRVPLLDAHRSGTFDPEADQVIEVGVPIRTKTSQLIFGGGGQMTVAVVVYDALAGTTERSSAEPVVGDSTLDSRKMITRRVLVTLSGEAPAASARVLRSVVLNAGEVPRAEAIRLARRKLARLREPARRVTIALPAVDFSIRRGSIVRAYNREGVSGLFVVTGYTITGERLGSREQKIAQTLDARELTAGRGSSV